MDERPGWERHGHRTSANRVAEGGVITIGTTTRIEVVSRSRRASATLLEIDLDEDQRNQAAIAEEAASRAYSRLSSPAAHMQLAEAVTRALAISEATPGSPAKGECEMPDGRLTRATRTVG